MEFQLYKKTERCTVLQIHQNKTRTRIVTLVKVITHDMCYREYHYRIVYTANGSLNHLSTEGSYDRAYTLYSGIVTMIS